MKNFIFYIPIQKVIGGAVALIFLLLLYACDSRIEEVAPQNKALEAGESIDGRYIVTLKADTETLRMKEFMSLQQRSEMIVARSQTVLIDNGASAESLLSTYEFAFSGFAAKLTQAQVKALRSDPRVAYIENDQVFRLHETNSSALSMSSTSSICDNPLTQTQAIQPGVQRVGGGTDNFLEDAKKRVYIMDSGIFIEHPDLNVEQCRQRMFNAYYDDINTIESTPCERNGTDPTDASGHGTHAAGIIGAIDNEIGVVGVAPGVKVVPVLVLASNGTGYLSNILKGLDFISYEVEKYSGESRVVNMSFWGSGSKTLDAAVGKLADKGVLFAVAAGNSSQPAKNFSPGRVSHRNVFTVAAMHTTFINNTWSDSWASISNYGQPPIKFAAPGMKIISTDVVRQLEPTLYYEACYGERSGTDMAAPHVAGLLVLNGTAINADGKVARNSKDIYPVAHK